jgi:hydrogenase/urease accessory protein HupE
MIGVRLVVLCLMSLFAIGELSAHEVRPAYLEIKEISPERYKLFWKTPARGNATIRLDVALPEHCTERAPRVSVNDGAAHVQRWSVECKSGLSGQEVRIDGLDQTLIETIVRFVKIDGSSQTARLMAGTDTFLAAEASNIAGVASAYVPLGIEHILFGFDHLCFVLALLLLINNTRRLIWAVTAFTVAHSITLAVATLGYVTAPPGPIESLIAFSIVLVAAEVVFMCRGKARATASRPWILAFGFGLLHGFGFAGALSETGLPGDAIPSALLFFNVGVEIGQLAFVAVALGAFVLARRFASNLVPRAVLATAYGIGTLAAFWTVERVAGIVS